MIKSLVTLFPYKRVKDLERENQELKEKIERKQDEINRTNAYWKKKMYHKKKAAVTNLL